MEQMDNKIDWKALVLEEGRRAAEEIARNMSDELRIHLAASEILERHMAAFEELAK